MRRYVSAVFAAITFISVISCASLSRNSGPPPGPVEIEVKNNLTIPSEITVYIVSAGNRQILGIIGSNDTKTFSFKPISYTETYRLIAQIPLENSIRSQPFNVGSEMTGVITWTLVPNIIGFWDVETDTVRVNDTTAAPPK